MRKNLLWAGAGFFLTLLILVAGYIGYAILTSPPTETPTVQPDTVTVGKTEAPPPVETQKDTANTPLLPAPPAPAIPNAAPPAPAKAAPKPVPGVVAPESPKAAAAKPSHSPVLDSGKISDAKEYASISGGVFDEQGNPIAGAEVTAAATGFDSETDAGFGLPFSDKQHVRIVTANERGTYEIAGIPFAGIVVLRAATSASTGGTRVQVKQGEERKGADITVSPGVPLTGRIVDVGGPAAGAIINVAAFLPESGRLIEGIGSGNLAKTDGQGEFRLAFREKGIATLQVTTAQDSQALFQNIPVGAPDTIELRVLRPATLQGHVTMSAGQAAIGATVVLTRKWTQFADPANGDITGPHLDGAGPVYLGEVGADGAYVISGVDPGPSFEVYARSSVKPLTEKQVIGPFLAGDLKVWDAVIEDEIVFRGYVVGANTRQPLASAYVYCRKRESNEPAAPIARAGADGAFEIHAGGGSGVYVLSPRYTASGPDLVAGPWMREVDCQAGGVYDIDLSLPEPCVLPVRVLDESGMAVRGAQVDIATALPNSVAMSPQVGTTDDQGRFVCTALIPGVETWLEISKAGCPRVRTRSYIGTPGQMFPEEVVPMAATSGIEGFAVAPDGTPLLNVRIAVLTQAQAANSLPLYTGTDARGYFIVRAGIPVSAPSIRLVLQTGADHPPAATIGPLQSVAGQVVNVGQVMFMPGQ